MHFGMTAATERRLQALRLAFLKPLDQVVQIQRGDLSARHARGRRVQAVSIFGTRNLVEI